ncbi:MAG: hypothetical protein HKM95_08865 [Inquilinus sp.]|nr:hypothetical protein [Inquilinus sp.]
MNDGTLSRATILAIAAGLAAWFAAALVAGSGGAFEVGPDEVPIRLVAAILAPPLLFGLALLASARLRAAVLGLDQGLLTMLQGWRVVGAMFVVLYLHDLLPGLFAWPAGLGDLAVGLAAPFVAFAVIRGSTGWRGRVLWLNIAGLVDFAVAAGTGLLSTGTALGVLAGPVTSDLMAVSPLSLFPTFGVPLFIILHMASLYKLAAERESAVPGAVAHA